MKKFNQLLNETLEVENLEELESSADLFQYGLDNGYYSFRQSQEFNKTYWQVKNRLLVNTIKNEFKDFSKLDLISIVISAPVSIKEDTKALVNYIRGIIKNLRKKQKIA